MPFALSEKNHLLNEPFWGVQAQIAKVLGSIGGPLAEEILISNLSLPHPKARRTFVEALKNFTNSENSSDALKNILISDSDSYFVESEACKSLGQLKKPESVPILIKQLDKNSHFDTIRQGALIGLSFIQSQETFNTILEWTKPGKSTQARITAIISLAKLGKLMNPEITFDKLSELTKEDNFRVKMATISAFRTLGNKKALSFLSTFYDREADGRFKKASYKTKLAIQKELEKPQELDLLKDEIANLKKENNKIKDSLSKLTPK